MSMFSVPIVRIGKVGKHPNADSLSLTQVEGCPVIFRTGDFNEGDTAIYVPVDAIVPPTVAGTEFLGDHRRIKAKKLRGIFSMGLLLPWTVLHHVPGLPVSRVEFRIGDDCANALGILKYEEPEPLCMQTDNAPAPIGVNIPVYDIESYRKFKEVFVRGETVVVTEKIHGTNARFYRDGNNLHVGTHRAWKKEDERNIWWRIAKKYDLANKIPSGYVLFGEIYGQVQDLKYDLKDIDFRAFDIMDARTGRFLNWVEFLEMATIIGVQAVPLLYLGRYVPEAIEPMCEGKSYLASCIREGFVIKPIQEKWDATIGRVILKLVGEGYLLRKGGTEHH